MERFLSIKIIWFYGRRLNNRFDNTIRFNIKFIISINNYGKKEKERIKSK